MANDATAGEHPERAPEEHDPEQRPGKEMPVMPGGPGGEVILPEHHEGREIPERTPLPPPDEPVPGPELPHTGVPGSPEVPTPPGHRPDVLV
jgi:hypothetical protein